MKLYSINLVLRAPSLLKLIKVITALSAGLDARSGLIDRVEPPEDTVAVVSTVYTLSTPAIVNISPTRGTADRASTASVAPV